MREIFTVIRYLPFLFAVTLSAQLFDSDFEGGNPQPDAFTDATKETALEACSPTTAYRCTNNSCRIDFTGYSDIHTGFSAAVFVSAVSPAPVFGCCAT